MTILDGPQSFLALLGPISLWKHPFRVLFWSHRSISRNSFSAKIAHLTNCCSVFWASEDLSLVQWPFIGIVNTPWTDLTVIPGQIRTQQSTELGTKKVGFFLVLSYFTQQNGITNLPNSFFASKVILTTK